MSTKVKRPPQHPAAAAGRAAQLPAGAQRAVPSPRASRRASTGGASSPGAAQHRGAQRHRDSSRQLSHALRRLLFPEQLPLPERIPKDSPRLSAPRSGPAARTELPARLRSQPGPPHVPCMGLLLGTEGWERCVTFPPLAGTQPAGAGFAPAAARLCLEVLFNFFKISCKQAELPSHLQRESRGTPCMQTVG
ncbi:uncharacterized protein LOC104914459 isoform X2 [Meleagris gallopavo]|uniref:uncharacterized protein LOC104914459 isoform X2 n=1 Tax=Meleagris gallopavo TaxID=9103 RepID=UPI000549D71C|nr:uncharacterized protein LOC104914459 isoform X2 [Meleagris gallopavo]